MEIFDQIVNEFSIIPHVKEWLQVQALFSRVASGKPRHWLLPLRACEAVGGSAEQSVPALVAVACSHIGIVLVDDMLDADPRGEHLRVGAPADCKHGIGFAVCRACSHCPLRIGYKRKIDGVGKYQRNVSFDDIGSVLGCSTCGK